MKLILVEKVFMLNFYNRVILVFDKIPKDIKALI